MSQTETRPYARPDQATLPDRVTMPLLDLVIRDSVDQDYVHAAQRRAAADPADAADASQSAHPRTALRWATVATAVFGLLIAVAAVQTSRNADVEEEGRQALLSRIAERKTEVAGAEDRIRDLRSDNDALRTASGRLRSVLGQATVDLGRLQIATGFVAVTGPGVQITVDDNPDGDADGRVRATDLQLLVNGLWEAGAEAVAVNGRRLSVISALSNSNIAINVNKTPLTPPYVVTAIGDERTLQADQLATASGQEFAALSQQYGYAVSATDVDSLSLPSAPPSQLRLRFAEEDDGVPDKQPDTTGGEAP